MKDSRNIFDFPEIVDKLKSMGYIPDIENERMYIPCEDNGNDFYFFAEGKFHYINQAGDSDPVGSFDEDIIFTEKKIKKYLGIL